MSQVFISAGHHDADPGATSNGATEAGLALELRDLLAAKLRSFGLDVVEDGVDGQNLPLSTAVKMIAGKVLAVELHFNAVANPAATGVECISLPANKVASQRLAAVTAGVLGLKTRGASGLIDQSQSARGKLAFVQNGGLILEVCFISNPADFVMYQKRKDVLAASLAETIKGIVNGT